MRVTLLILCFVLLGFLRCALAVPGPTTHPKDVIIEKTLQVKGLGSNNDVDVLEVDKNSNLKGDVRVGGDLQVVGNASMAALTLSGNITGNQGVTIALGLTVGGNLDVAGNLDIDGALTTDDLHVQGKLEVDGDTTLGGNVQFDALEPLWEFAGDIAIKVLGLGARRAFEDLVKYDSTTGRITLNNGKFEYDPVTGIRANNGAASMDSFNGGTEFRITNNGEAVFKQGPSGDDCALRVTKHPNNTNTSVPTVLFEGPTRITDELRVDSNLILGGEFVSSGDLRKHATDTDVTATGAVASTLGQTFEATASCSGSKVILGGGCAISGASTTGLVLKQSAPSGQDYLCQYVQGLKEFNEFFNETIPVAIDATITATVFCATSIA